jgi:hypothetical protein
LSDALNDALFSNEIQRRPAKPRKKYWREFTKKEAEPPFFASDSLCEGTMGKRYKNELREFLAIISDGGEKTVLDEALVRKYNLRAGMVSPFSRYPIVSVTKRVRVEIAPRRNVRLRLKSSPRRRLAKRIRPRAKSARRAARRR